MHAWKWSNLFVLFEMRSIWKMISFAKSSQIMNDINVAVRYWLEGKENFSFPVNSLPMASHPVNPVSQWYYHLIITFTLFNQYNTIKFWIGIYSKIAWKHVSHLICMCCIGFQLIRKLLKQCYSLKKFQSSFFSKFNT